MATPVSSVSAELIVSIVAIVISVLSFIWGLVKYGITLENRLTKIETKTELWWNTVADQMKQLVQQPIHYRKDDLLDRFPNISNSELNELKEILIFEIKDLKERKDPIAAAYAIWRARVEVECLERSGILNKGWRVFNRVCDMCSLPFLKKELK